MRNAALGLLLALLAWGVSTSAQTPPVQVFVERGAEGDTLAFVNLATGSVTRVAVGNGEQYTAAGEGVVYWDGRSVQLATPNGETGPHPFIDSGANAQRVDWAVSNDGRFIAWTVTTADANGRLSTVTRVAHTDGRETRVVLRDGPREGIRALPVAFGAEDNTLYMDYQPDTLGAATPYDEYAGLFTVNLKADAEAQLLPGEPGCYCGAGFGGGYLVRLALSAADAFAVRVLNRLSGVENTLDPLPLNGFTQGGDVLVSPDGRRALYALAQVEDFGTPAQQVLSVFVLVDLEAQTQEQITIPQTLYLRPQAWTENNSAVILTSPTRAGTWKMALDGRLDVIAEATYVGTLNRTTSRSLAETPPG